jgi:hypothetical protein
VGYSWSGRCANQGPCALGADRGSDLFRSGGGTKRVGLLCLI